MESLGKLMFVTGLALAMCGALIWLFAGKSSGGLLPGDLVIDKDYRQTACLPEGFGNPSQGSFPSSRIPHRWRTLV